MTLLAGRSTPLSQPGVRLPASVPATMALGRRLTSSDGQAAVMIVREQGPQGSRKTVILAVIAARYETIGSVMDGTVS